MLKNIKRKINSFLARGHAMVLTYHGVTSEALPLRMWTHVEKRLFEEHMKLLSDKAHCISLSELLEDALRDKLRPKTVAITFDDGFCNNYHEAFPILEKYRIPATVFVAAGFTNTNILIWPERLSTILAISKLDKFSYDGVNYDITDSVAKESTYKRLAQILKNAHPYDIPRAVDLLSRLLEVDADQVLSSECFQHFRMATYDQLIELKNSGLVEIGAHTVNHAILSKLTDEQAMTELSQSKALLEDNIGREVRYFAYPNGGVGDYTRKHREMAEAVGYRAVLTAISGTVTSKSDPFDLRRIGIGANCRVCDLDYLIHGGARPRS